MKHPSTADGTSRIQITARTDRRQAEMLALALRRRLKELGYDTAVVTVSPARDDSAPA